MSNKYRVLLVLFIFVCLLFSLSFWLFGQSRISVELSNKSQLIILDTKGNEIINKSELIGNYSQRVPRGEYSVTVVSGTQSAFTNISTRPFLGNTKVSTPLTKERSREFIGKSPGICGYYDKDTDLITHSCGGTYGDAAIHSPANNERSSTTINNATDIEDASLGGFFRQSGKIYALTEQSITLPRNEIVASFQEIGEGLKPRKNIPINSISSDKFHLVTPYKEGVLVYSTDFRDFYYFNDLTQPAETVSLELPDQSKFTGVGVSVYGSMIATAFKSTSTIEKENLDSGTIGASKTFINIFNEGENYSFSFDETYSDFRLCAKDIICYYTNETLVVYRFNKGNIKELYRIGGVQYLSSSNDKIIASTSQGLLVIDPKERSGYFAVTYRNYDVCGLNITHSQNIVLCIVDEKNNQHALSIDLGAEIQFEIDAKLGELAKLPFVDTVSIYKNFIHLTPDVGEPVLTIDPVNGGDGFISDPILVEKTANQINEAIEFLGIDRSKYTIINTQL